MDKHYYDVTSGEIMSTEWLLTLSDAYTQMRDAVTGCLRIRENFVKNGNHDMADEMLNMALTYKTKQKAIWKQMEADRCGLENYA